MIRKYVLAFIVAVSMLCVTEPAGAVTFGSGDVSALMRNFDAATANMDTLGMTSARIAVTWDRVQPTGDTPIDLTYATVMADRLHAQGKQAVLMLWSPPEWAQEVVCGDLKLPRLVPWMAFLATALERIPSADVVQVLNEPNLPENRRSATPECRTIYRKAYADLLTASTRLIRSAGARSMMGGIYRGSRGANGDATSPWAWVRAMREANADFDVIGIHPYPVTWRRWAGDASRAQGTVDLLNLAEWISLVDELWPEQQMEVMQVRVTRKIRKCRPRPNGKLKCRRVKVVTIGERLRALPRQKPKTIWVSEMGYLSYQEGAVSTDPRVVPEPNQAKMVSDMMAWIAAGNLSPRVEAFYWMTITDGVSDPWPGGLLRADGSPKPAWDAWLDWLPKPISTNDNQNQETSNG